MVSFVPDAGAGRLALQGQVEVLAGQDGLMVPNLIVQRLTRLWPSYLLHMMFLQIQTH